MSHRDGATSSAALVKSSSASSIGVASPPEQVLSPASSHGPLIIRPIKAPTSRGSSPRRQAAARNSNSSEITTGAATTDPNLSLLPKDPQTILKTEIRPAAPDALTSPATQSWESVKLDPESSESTTVTWPISDWTESESGDGHHIDVGAWPGVLAEDQKEPGGQGRPTICCKLL
jgi:hypothetical protein